MSSDDWEDVSAFLSEAMQEEGHGIVSVEPENEDELKVFAAERDISLTPYPDEWRAEWDDPQDGLVHYSWKKE